MFTISGFYKFKKINSLKKHKIYLEKKISNTSIRGSIIISSEGINGSLAGNSKDILKILDGVWIRKCVLWILKKLF